MADDRDDRIEFSSSGLKLSYLRFLADGAAGLIIILLLLTGYYYDLPLERHVPQMGQEVKIFFLVVFVILSIPLGLFVNALGWFLFGGLQARGAGFWFEHPENIFTTATNRNYSFKLVKDYFGLTRESFYELSQLHEDAAFIFHGFVTTDAAHIKGIKRLIRSVVIIVLLAAPFLVPHFGWWCLLVFPVIAVLLFLLTLLEYYERLGILQKIYILSLDESVLTDAGQAALKRLVRGGLPGRLDSAANARKG